MFGKLKTWTAAALLAPFAVSAAEVDGIAARVGSDTVLRSEVEQELQRAGKPADRFDEELQALIDRKLILKAAADAKVTMQDWVVENRVREIIDRAFGGDRNKLMAMLQSQKIAYPEWRARMKDDLIASAMVWQTVEKNVVATPGLMRREFADHPERYAVGRRCTVEVILLKPEEVGKRAEIDAALKAGTPFADLARKYSADGKASAGGLWKDVDPETTFKPEVNEAVERIGDGETSAWVEISGWSFLVHRLSVVASGSRSFAEAYDDIEKNVRAAEYERIYKAWIERLRKASYVKIY